MNLRKYILEVFETTKVHGERAEKMKQEIRAKRLQREKEAIQREEEISYDERYKDRV